jgi:hypothetical protein
MTKFIKFHAITNDGGTAPYWMDPRHIAGVSIALVPSKLKGPSGNMHTEKAAIDLGLKMIPVDQSPDEAVHMIEEALNQLDGQSNPRITDLVHD